MYIGTPGDLVVVTGVGAPTPFSNDTRFGPLLKDGSRAIVITSVSEIPAQVSWVQVLTWAGVFWFPQRFVQKIRMEFREKELERLGVTR